MYKKNIFKIISSTLQTIWSLEEVNNYLRVESDNDNELIASLIEAAIISAENFTKLMRLKIYTYHNEKVNSPKFSTSN